MRLRPALLALAVAAGLVPHLGAAAATPNDPEYSKQWALPRIGAPTAWDRGRGAGVTIAIVDTGIASGHPDLAAKLVAGIDLVEPGTAPEDDHSHGTHVAGIAAAATFNGTGIAGTAPDARLMPVKVLNRDGEGRNADVEAGIRWAADRGARVINLSLGDYAQGVTGTSLASGCAYAYSRGSLCVAAAGNTTLLTDAGVDREPILVVSATDDADRQAAYSSGVGNARWGIAAPGGGAAVVCTSCIWSTVPGGYGYKAGTSMAAPHVSGAVAVLMGLGLSADAAVERLLATARPLGNRSQFGAGLLDMAKATAGLSAAPAPPATTATTAPTTTSTTSPGSTTSTTAPGSTTTTTAPSQGAATRLAGSDRIETAVAVARHSHPGGSTDVVLARADGFADALAGTPLAASLNAPLLLTGVDAMDPRTMGEIDRLLGGSGTVHLLGGHAALSPAVERTLADRGYATRRHAGADRFETAVRIAVDGLGDPGTVLLATGTEFADALVAGAAAPRAGGAVLLTAGSSLPGATRDHLRARPGLRRYAVGRPAAAADPGATALVGGDPADTSRVVAERFLPAPGAAGVASLATFPDGLGGGAHAAAVRGPLLLTDPASLSPAVARYLRDRSTSIDRAFVYGGPAAVSEDVRRAVGEAIS